MEKKLTVAPGRDHIVMEVTGDITRRGVMDANMEAHKLGQELGINRFLVDLVNCRNREDVVDNYEFAYQDMRTAPEIDRKARVVLLVSPEDHSHDFIETVTRNIGLDVTIFTDREEAVRHLGTGGGG